MWSQDIQGKSTFSRDKEFLVPLDKALECHSQFWWVTQVRLTNWNRNGLQNEEPIIREGNRGNRWELLTNLWYNCHMWHRQSVCVTPSRSGRWQAAQLPIGQEAASRAGDWTGTTGEGAESRADTGQRSWIRVALGESKGLICSTPTKKVSPHSFNRTKAETL